jgi:sugar phosphate isomerase/epimerase
MDRRTFIGSVTAAGLMSRVDWAASEHRIGKIGVQLYTVRDALSKDFEGTLAKVAKIGYKEVEFAGYFAHIPEFNPSPKRTREILDADGLSAPRRMCLTALAPENWPEGD